MKRMCVIGAGLMLALASGAANAQTYADTVKGDNPLAYFQLNSVGQGSAVNGWTANWDGSVTTGTGAPLASDPGNQAAVFDGRGGGISTDVTGISGTAGTLMAWINGPAPGGDYRTVVDASNFGNAYGLTYQGSGVQGSNQQRIDFSYGGGTYQTGLLNIADGWHFIVGTFDSAAGVANLYIDGNLEGSSTSNVFDLGSRTDQFAIGKGGANYCDGAGGTFCSGPQSMNGSIDEVGVFNYALSADQIASLYAARNDMGSPVMGAVPEPASWAMMILGFGMIGAGLRYRRRATILRYV